MGVQVLNHENFSSFIKSSDRPVIVDFYADWCGPCKMMSPLLDEIAEEKSEIVHVCKLNVDENQKIAIEYGIRSIPCIISFKNGEVYKRIVGAVPKDDLLTLLD